MKSIIWTLFLASCLTAGQSPITPNVQRALNAVTAAELRGDLSFLASDTLQGRFTPSPGLDVAAEFIASKFRAAGLEPGGGKDYFQTAEMVDRHFPAMSSNLVVYAGEKRMEVAAAELAVQAASQASHFDHLPAVLFTTKDPELLKGIDLHGKAVLAIGVDLQSVPRDQLMSEYLKMRAFDKAVAASGAAINLTISKSRQSSFGPHRPLTAEQAAGGVTPSVSVASEELFNLIRAKNELLSISLDVPAPDDIKFTAKNVIGILRGSDPVLSKTAVLLTAHYDHIGTVDTAKGLTMGAPASSSDKIYNGANDDGSGTVSVVEIARAMVTLKPRPRRSIVFMTFFGEERGELGSEFYGKHPVFPIDKTVADLNLEQVGRTDATNGKQINNASVTGFDYSDVTKFLIAAGKQVGINVYRDAEASDQYFARSDNAALAEQGVPAHTLCVAFDYPDYHGLGDEWPKIDYENMAKVDRMVLLALNQIANTAKPPSWNDKNEKTKPFREARTH